MCGAVSRTMPFVYRNMRFNLLDARMILVVKKCFNLREKLLEKRMIQAKLFLVKETNGNRH